ncbi:MAG: prepilin peptidase [Moorellaceae bacterium]
MPGIRCALLVGLCLLASGVSVYTDVRWGKIKNYVTLPLLCFGVIWLFVMGGPGLLLAGLIVGTLSGTLVSGGGKFGAGDIKLIAGIALNLTGVDIRLGILFVCFFFIMLAASAIFIRLKAYGFNFKVALEKMKAEAALEIGGCKDANVLVHGDKVKHIGAPVIFTALVASLITAKIGGIVW